MTPDKYTKEKLEEFQNKLETYDKDGGFIAYVEDYDNQDYNTDLITEYVANLITQTQKDTMEEVLGEIEKVVTQDFPRGERRWCIECAERIKKHLKDVMINKKSPTEVVGRNEEEKEHTRELRKSS